MNSPPPCPCPHCGVLLNFHVTPDGKDTNPALDDVTLCSECDSFLIFDRDLLLRVPTAAETAVMFRSLESRLVRLFRNANGGGKGNFSDPPPHKKRCRGRYWELASG